MELRGQSSTSYNPPQSNQESSSKLPSAPTISSLADRRRNQTSHGHRILASPQTLDHHHPNQHLQRHQLNLQEQQEAHVPVREPSSDPDPDPAPSASATPAADSNPKIPPSQWQPQPQSQQDSSSAYNDSTSIRYRECLRNHAAPMGSHALDGCGEFMPSGEDGTPEALKCAACECHRNFHRKEGNGDLQFTVSCHHTYNTRRNGSQRTTIHPPSTPPPPSFSAPPSQQYHEYSHGYSHGLASLSAGPTPPMMMMTFGGTSTTPAESSSEDLDMFQSNNETEPSNSLSKKRFRTKFTQEQKDRMHEFAEKLGWKVQKQNELEVQHFCNEVGIKRQVFKVWMHNNKQASKKKQV